MKEADERAPNTASQIMPAVKHSRELHRVIASLERKKGDCERFTRERGASGGINEAKEQIEIIGCGEEEEERQRQRTVSLLWNQER